VNSATVRATRTPKHRLLSDPAVRATAQSALPQPVIVFDDLPRRWEQIVAKGQS
jgi:hypothetical protein